MKKRDWFIIICIYHTSLYNIVTLQRQYDDEHKRWTGSRLWEADITGTWTTARSLSPPAVFCVYYIIRGVLQENRLELMAFVLTMLVLVARSVVIFAVQDPEDRRPLLVGKPRSSATDHGWWSWFSSHSPPLGRRYSKVMRGRPSPNIIIPANKDSPGRSNHGPAARCHCCCASGSLPGVCDHCDVFIWLTVVADCCWLRRM